MSKIYILLFLDVSPPPGNYDTKSDFAKPGTSESKRERPHNYTFGISHDAYRKVYMPHQKRTVDTDLPGPGTYTNKHLTMGQEGKKWAFQGKLQHFAGKYTFHFF